MKKILAVMLSVMFVLSGVAFAEQVPSKTGRDLTRATYQRAEVSFEIGVAEDAWCTKIINAMAAVVAQQKSPIVFFEENADADTVNAISAFFAGNTIEVTEATTVRVNADAEPADVTATITFPTQYTANQSVALTVGVTDASDNEKAVWTVIPSSVDESGNVIADFSADLIKSLSKSTGVVFVLNTPAE